jgi:serine/threonine protein phosphatase PrpC
VRHHPTTRPPHVRRSLLEIESSRPNPRAHAMALRLLAAPSAAAARRRAGRVAAATLLPPSPPRRLLAASFGTGAAAASALSSAAPGPDGRIPLPPHKDAGAFSLDLLAEATCLAHPDKKRGEDAWFATRYAVGIADGVGGWASVGVDAGAYARAFMEQCAGYLDAAVAATVADGASVEPDPAPAMAAAHARVTLPGSTTAVLATAGAGGDLRLLNLGDSAGMLLRWSPPPVTDHGAAPLRPEEAAKLWAPLLKTREQTHGHTFNMPLQLCCPRYGQSDEVTSAEAYVVAPAPGDVLLLGTDGLWDNLRTPDIVAGLARVDWAPVREYVRLKRRRYLEAKAVATSARDALAAGADDDDAAPTTNKKAFVGGPLERFKIRNLSASDVVTDAELADAEKRARSVLRSASGLLAVRAQAVGADPRARTPFGEAASARGLRQFAVGGKLDDVTVLLAVVVPDEARPRLAPVGGGGGAGAGA